MKICSCLQEVDIIAEMAAAGKETALSELAARVAERHPGFDRGELVAVLLERERLGSTGIGDGVAIPHGKLRGIKEQVMVFGRSRPGVDFQSLDGRPAHLFFLLIAPEENIGGHLKMLARISRILKDPAVRRHLLDAPDAAAIHAIIRQQDSQ